MKRFLCLLSLLCLLAEMPVFAGVTLPQGTAVMIQTERKIDADKVHEGDAVQLTVLQPVKVNGQVVINSGTPVYAKVVRKKNNCILGVPGELEVSHFMIYTSENETIHLRGTILNEGEARYWANVGWFFLFPLLFIKGDDGIIPANSQYTIFTLEDVNL